MNVRIGNVIFNTDQVCFWEFTPEGPDIMEVLGQSEPDQDGNVSPILGQVLRRGNATLHGYLTGGGSRTLFGQEAMDLWNFLISLETPAQTTPPPTMIQQAPIPIRQDFKKKNKR